MKGLIFIDAGSFDDGSYDQEYDTLFFKVMRLSFDNTPDTNCLEFYHLELSIEELSGFNDQVAFLL